MVVGSRLIDIVLSHFFVFLFATCYYVLSPLFFRGFGGSLACMILCNVMEDDAK